MKKRDKKRERLIRRILLSVALAAALGAAGWCAAYAVLTREDPMATVAVVDGAPVALGELKMQFDRKRAEAVSHFTEGYGADAGDKHFWTTAFDGVTPRDYLIKISLDAVKREKAEQLLMQEYGMEDDITYEGFLKELKAENARRRQAKQNGEAIYGPEEYTPSAYWDYVMSNRRIRLDEKLFGAGGELEPDEETLRAYYEQIKDPYFKQVDNVELLAFSIPYRGQGGGAVTEEDARTALEPVRERVAREGEAARTEAEKVPGLIVTALSLNKETVSSASKSAPVAYQHAKELPAKETSEVFNHQGEYTFLYCVSRESGGYRSFDQHINEVRAYYGDDAYQRLIDEKTKQADMAAVPGALKHVRVA